MGGAVYVTGAAGMIGSVVCREALRGGYRVIGVDNLSRGSIGNIADLRSDRNFTFVHADLTADPSWARNLGAADVVIHLADIVAGIGFVFQNEWSIFNRNILINSHLARILDIKRPKHLIYIGTACSYPQAKQRAVDGTGLVEDDKFPADPESGYGWSKLVGDIEYRLLCRSANITYTNLDLHNVYGAPCDFDPATAQVIPSLVYKALTQDRLVVWGDGRQGRAFVEVRDVARAVLAAVDQGTPGSFMIGPAECTTINQVVELLLAHPRIKARQVDHDMTKPIGDIGRSYGGSLTFEKLGWQPRIPLGQGIADLVDYVDGKIRMNRVA
jgi:GDP-D-mannose 3',5'-epimerase